jgi:hypothetical protein
MRYVESWTYLGVEEMVSVECCHKYEILKSIYMQCLAVRQKKGSNHNPQEVSMEEVAILCF